MLFTQLMPDAFSLALASAGNNKPARMAMMAMTTSSSISVKANAVARWPGRRTQVRLESGIKNLSCGRLLGYVRKIADSLRSVNVLPDGEMGTFIKMRRYGGAHLDTPTKVRRERAPVAPVAEWKAPRTRSMERLR